jgi:hypothetical protein
MEFLRKLCFKKNHRKKLSNLNPLLFHFSANDFLHILPKITVRAAMHVKFLEFNDRANDRGESNCPIPISSEWEKEEPYQIAKPSPFLHYNFQDFTWL